MCFDRMCGFQFRVEILILKMFAGRQCLADHSPNDRRTHKSSWRILSGALHLNVLFFLPIKFSLNTSVSFLRSLKPSMWEAYHKLFIQFVPMSTDPSA